MMSARVMTRLPCPVGFTVASELIRLLAASKMRGVPPQMLEFVAGLGEVWSAQTLSAYLKSTGPLVKDLGSLGLEQVENCGKKRRKLEKISWKELADSDGL